MASNITSAAGFTFINMKPAADEEIPALWGQAIAENTGYLYYKKHIVGNLHTYHSSDGDGLVHNSGNENHLIIYPKEEGYNYITGTIYSEVNLYSGSFDGYNTLSFDGTAMTSNIYDGTTHQGTYTFSWNMSSKATNYPIVMRMISHIDASVYQGDAAFNVLTYASV